MIVLMYLASFPIAFGLVAIAVSPLFPERWHYRRLRYKGARRRG